MFRVIRIYYREKSGKKQGRIQKRDALDNFGWGPDGEKTKGIPQRVPLLFFHHHPQ
jgi:hypothetical protein